MFNEGNALALIALLAWPLVVVVLFRSLSLERALIWSILGGYMALPQVSAINFPLIPAFDKVTIPNLTAFACCVAIWGRLPSVMPASWPGRVLMLAFLLSPSLTVLTNMQPIRFGIDNLGGLQIIDFHTIERDALRGLRIYDSASALAQQLLLMLPFFLAREALRTPAAMREILVALVVAGCIYTLPMLLEIRLSPQLHIWTYGFFQHDFIQAVRAGGFRPFVFMPHGLWVAFFAFMVLMAAMTLWRTDPQQQRARWAAAVVLGVGLVVICKTMGAILYALVFAPLALLARPRQHLTLAIILSVVVLTYPALRGMGLIPTGDIVARVAPNYPDRAQSLGYRFGNEDRVLAHASERPLLGWGTWGRFIPHDPETGSSRVVVDGLWVITIGTYGWLGYAALFGLLALPLWSLWWQARQAQAPPPAVVTVLALLLAVNMVDLLPNATLIPFTWLIAGALLGHAEDLARDRANQRRRARAGRHANVVLGRADPIPGQGPRSLL
jgi:hypothetical protein